MMHKIILKIKSFFIHLFLGMKSADDIVINSNKNNIDEASEHTIKLETDSLYGAMLKAEVTQQVKEVRHQTYAVAKESKNYEYSGNGNADKKVKTKYNTNIENLENYKVLLIQDNGIIVQDTLDILEQIGSYSKENKYLVSIERDFIPRFKMEEFCKKIVVKQINDEEVQLDFYTSVYAKQFMKKTSIFVREMERIRDGYRLSDIIDFDKVSFVTNNAFGVDDIKHYVFNNIKYLSTSVFDGNFVSKFKANIEINGDDLTQKYNNEIMSKKYANKDRKGPQMISLDILTDTDEIIFDNDKANTLLDKLKNNNEISNN